MDIAPLRNPPVESRARALVEIALILGSAIVFLRFSWLKWPDVLIDFGRELYVPWMITKGNVLYRDILYFAPPLSPYWNALCFSLLGTGLSSLVWVNIGLLFALIATMHHVLCRTASRFSAVVACLMFVLLFAFGHYTIFGSYNYVAPYSHEATHGMLLCWISLACQLAHIRSNRMLFLVASGITLGLAFLTKPELFVGAAAASGTALALWGWRHSPGTKRVMGRVALFHASLLAPALAAWALLAIRLPWKEAGIGVLGSWWYLFDDRIMDLRFYRDFIGISDPRLNLERMAYVLGLCLAVFVPATALARARPGRGIAIAVAASTFSILLAATFWARPTFPWNEIGRPLPLVLLVAGAAVLRRAVRYREERDEALLVLVAFAFFLQLKMLLNATLWHYGFILGMPATMVVVILILDWIPAAVRRRGGHPFAFQAMAVAFLAAAAVAHVDCAAAAYRIRSVPVGEGADAFLADPRGLAVNDAVAWIKQTLHPAETLAVLPEGVIINYLARRPNPTPILNLMPPEMIMFGGDRLLRMLQDVPPTYIALVHRDMSEFGYRFFGQDYGRSFREWILLNYHPVWQTGTVPFVEDRFGIVIVEHNGHRHEPGRPPPVVSDVRAAGT